MAIVQINFAGPFWATSCRIGEAANPGPWSLSAINPTGLAGKASVFDDLATGVHAISETHLTAQGTTRFRQELRGNKSRYQLIAGHPAPYRSANLRSCGGKHTGVGFLSPFPCRQIAHGWQQRLYSTSRLVAAAFWIGSSWIFGGVAYGFAHDAHTREVQQNTDELLQELTTQVVHCGHPLAFVAGDWNQEHGVLLEPLKWEQRGWKDIQTLAAQRWGIQETVTCKQTTRKDFLYLSPGLQDLLISVTNTWDFFADHSCLQAVLHDPSAPPLEARWFRPRIIPYDDATFVAHLANTKVTSPSLPEPMTDRYQAICQQLEAHVDDTLGKLGKPRLVRSQKGRGTTLTRTLHRVACAPVKSSREGEPIPEYVGPNLRYKQWFTQARRLSSYVNLMKTGRRDDLALEQRVRNWNAVLRSSGFAVSFADWWPFRSAKTHDGPLQIPLEPPGHLEAQSIYQEFMREVTHLGQILRHRQQEALKHKYDSNPNAVYRDVTKPSTVPVQVLLAKHHTEVVEICSPEQVRVAPGLTVSPRTTVTAGEATLMVTECHSEQGTLTFAQAHSLEVGDVLIQTAHHGSVPEIHNLFADEWSKRWDKHRQLPEDHWQEICTYIDLALEGSPMPSQPITLKQLQHTLRSKKARSATGMDGVSKQDLVHAPEHLQESLTQLLNDVEISGNWPEQLLHGAIHSLAKVPNAEEVGQFRPVTVLPMMYRVWSSIRSRQILAHLGIVAPPTMLGNMPHKDAPTFWWQLQLEVENAQLTDMPMAGVTTDLIKAFNGLPREPILHAARKLGIPDCILRAWKAAAAGIQRHFYVRDQPGPPLTSVTGFVEGCGMSVCAMAIYCLVLHSYAANKVPRAVMYSYVDNLEFLSGDPDAACFAWGTTAPLRRTLEDQVPLVMLSAKDLGGHLQFSGKQTNFSVKSKCQDLQWLWRKLAQSRAPLTQKLKVLTTVAWPRVFHSASIVHLSDAILTDLRRDAVKALGINKSGLNPQVFLSLQGNALCDPGFFILWDALSKFRRFATESLVEAMLSQVAWTPSRIKRPGPIGVLTSRLSQIGWAWSHVTQFRDHTGECIDIMHCPIQELRYRVKRSWHHMVGQLVMERKGYGGIQTVDAWTSVMPAPDLSPEENGLLRTLQAGTFMTHDHLQPAGLVDSKSCKFCGQDDSMEHRHWRCPETQSLRDMVPPDVLKFMHTGPACARERGWFCEPVALQTFKSSLKQIPDQTQVWEPWSCPTETVDLFTDGTCVDPILPTARLTAWAVVMGGPGTWQACHFLPLAAGGVPGQWQTVHRAEATALLSALKYASRIPQAVRIWCDNAAVLRKALALQQQRAQVRRTDNDHDIWESIQQVLNPISHRVTLHKVDSHQDRSTSSPVEEWIFAGNQAADDLAAQTLRDLNPTVVAAQREAAREIRFSRQCQQEVMRFYAKVGIKSVIWNQTHEPDQVTFGQIPIEDDEVLDFRALAHQAEDFPARFKTAKFSCTLSWLHFIHDPMSPPVWVTWYELLWSFQMFTGSRGVQKVSQIDWALFDLMKEYDTPSASRSMAYYLTSMYRQLDPGFCSTHTKPDNYRWQHWAMCIPLRWSATDKTRVRQWMQEQLGSKQLTQLTRDTSNLPPATDACVAPLPDQHRPVGLHRFFRRVG